MEDTMFAALRSKGPATVKQLAKAAKIDEDEAASQLADFKLRQYASVDDAEDPEKAKWSLTEFGSTQLAQRYDET
jgi:hypothetical protein